MFFQWSVSTSLSVSSAGLRSHSYSELFSWKMCKLQRNGLKGHKSRVAYINLYSFLNDKLHIKKTHNLLEIMRNCLEELNLKQEKEERKTTTSLLWNCRASALTVINQMKKVHCCLVVFFFLFPFLFTVMAHTCTKVLLYNRKVSSEPQTGWQAPRDL